MTFLKQCKLTEGRLTRWTLALQEYDLQITYIKGKDNVAADVITRYPRIIELRNTKEIFINKLQIERFSDEKCKELRNIKDSQKEDKKIEKLRVRKNKNITIINEIVFYKKQTQQQVANRSSRKISKKIN